MLSHLTENQIRMCLDQSGIPDVPDVTEPVVAAAAAASASAGPIETITLADGTQKQVEERVVTLPDGTLKKLQPGEGSSSDPLPTNQRTSAAKMFIKNIERNDQNTPYIIKDVTKKELPIMSLRKLKMEMLY